MSERRDREVAVCMPHLPPLSSTMMTLRIHGTNGLFFFVDHGINIVPFPSLSLKLLSVFNLLCSLSYALL